MSETTITRTEYRKAVEAARMKASIEHGVAEAFRIAGIRIADPEPPLGMVKLAREIYLNAHAPEGVSVGEAAALAALQYAVKVVEDATRGGRLVVASDIIAKLRGEN